jgi:hypothetical protein
MAGTTQGELNAVHSPRGVPLQKRVIGAEMKLGMNRIGWHRMQKSNTQERERLEYV